MLGAGLIEKERTDSACHLSSSPPPFFSFRTDDVGAMGRYLFGPFGSLITGPRPPPPFFPFFFFFFLTMHARRRKGYRPLFERRSFSPVDGRESREVRSDCHGRMPLLPFFPFFSFSDDFPALRRRTIFPNSSTRKPDERELTKTLPSPLFSSLSSRRSSRVMVV